jgi:Intracellular proteinase inhibitor
MPTKFSILRVLTMTLVIVCAGMLSGCGGSGDASPTPSPLPPPGLALTLNVGSARNPGESIPLELVLSNPGNQPVIVLLTGRQDSGLIGTFNFFVKNSGDTEVWNWLHDKTWILPLSQVTIDPGQKMTFKGGWEQRDNQEQPVQPGTYDVYGTLRGETDERADFELMTEPQELDIS